MLTNEHQRKIAAAIAENRRNYPSDAKHAHALGISTSVYSSIKNGDTEQKLGEANWITIARKLNVHLRDTPAWKIVKTPAFQYIYAQLEACQRGGLSKMFCDIPDIGKTVTARYYASQNPNVVYVDCGQVKSRQRLVRFLAREFGLNAKGGYAGVYEDLVYYLRELPNPLIILDEAGDLQYDAYLELKALWNATEHYCGWYQMGATALKAKIERGIEREKVGFDEMKSRHNGKYDRVTPVDGRERDSFMLQQAELIAKANVQENHDYRQIARASGGSPRRVYTLINKPSTL